MFNIQVTTLDPNVMLAFSNFFADLARQGVHGKIDPIDSPDVGADVIRQPPASILQPQASAFPIEKNAATVFGGNGVLGATGATTADPNIAQSDPAAVFGGNVSAVSSSVVIASGSDTAVLDPAQSINNAQTPSSVMLDSYGLPWDVRIHAGTRTQTQKGEWKRKKGVDDATVAAVEVELRTALAAPSAPAKPFTPLNATAHDGEGVHAASAPHEKVNIPPPPPPPTFAELCKYVTGRAFKSDQILAVCNAHGLAGLGLAACRPDLIPSIYKQFSAL